MAVVDTNGGNLYMIVSITLYSVLYQLWAGRADERWAFAGGAGFCHVLPSLTRPSLTVRFWRVSDLKRVGALGLEL